MIYYNAAQALGMYEEANGLQLRISGLFAEVKQVFDTDIPVVFQGSASAGIVARENVVMGKFEEVDQDIQKLLGQAAPDEVQELVQLDRALGD